MQTSTILVLIIIGTWLGAIVLHRHLENRQWRRKNYRDGKTTERS